MRHYPQRSFLGYITANWVTSIDSEGLIVARSVTIANCIYPFIGSFIRNSLVKLLWPNLTGNAKAITKTFSINSKSRSLVNLELNIANSPLMNGNSRILSLLTICEPAKIDLLGKVWRNATLHQSPLSSY